MIPCSKLQTFDTLPFSDVLPPHKDRARLGYTFIEPPAHLKRYGDFYGTWVLPDGRVAKWNTWMSQLTIYPASHRPSVKCK